MRILVVEDERDLNDVLTKRLKDGGYSVDSCYDGIQVWEYLQMGEYDTVLLDIMLPGMDGLKCLVGRTVGQNSCVN